MTQGERKFKPLSSNCILLKKDVKGEGEADKQGNEGGKEEERLAEDGEEDVKVDAEVRKVTHSEKESRPGK